MDDRPFGSRVAPATLYYASRNQRHKDPPRHLREFPSILQADAYEGYFARGFCLPGPIMSAQFRAHARRQFFKLADIAAIARRGRKAAARAPEAVRRIDMMFDIERGINGDEAHVQAYMTPAPAPDQAALHQRSGPQLRDQEAHRSGRHVP